MNIKRSIAAFLKRIAERLDESASEDFSLISASYEPGKVTFTAYKGATTRMVENHPLVASSADSMRYAAYIQEARDNKLFSVADDLRKRAEGWGMKVFQTKNSTIIHEGWSS